MHRNILRYVFPYIESNMYLMIEGTHALMVDPHYSKEAEELLNEKKIEDVTMLLTHEHFDHTSGIVWIRENFKSRLICQKNALLLKSQKYCNRPTVLEIILTEQNLNEIAKQVDDIYKPYTYDADQSFDNDLNIEWYSHKLQFISIPGHSPASVLITLDDECVFTGDSLIPNTITTTRWPGSDARKYYDYTLPILLNISPEMFVYPGHGEPVKMENIKYIDQKFVVA